MHFHWSLVPALILSLVWLYRTFHAVHTVISTPTLFPAKETRRDNHPSVSILIPARNEEKNIGICISSLVPQLGSQDEIIVINDRSSDGTETVLKNLGAKLMESRDPQATGSSAQQLYYINLDHTDESWTGKNYALNQAIPHARGDWLLFTDADTEHYPGSLIIAVDYAVKSQIDYLTLWPKCVTKSFWEHVIQTCSFSFIGLWFPTHEVNNPDSDHYFANGQYALIKRSHYQKIGGHAAVKEAFLEDFAMMKKTKQIGGRGIVAMGAHLYGTHMYDGLKKIRQGWRRIYLHGFERNPITLFLKAMELILFSTLPFLLLPLIAWLSYQNPEDWFITYFLLGLIIFNILIVAWEAAHVVRARKVYSFLHPIGAFALALIFLDAMKMAITGEKTKWR